MGGGSLLEVGALARRTYRFAGSAASAAAAAAAAVAFGRSVVAFLPPGFTGLVSCDDTGGTDAPAVVSL